MTPCEHDPILHDEMQWNVCLATFRGKLEPDGCFFYVNVGSVFRGLCRLCGGTGPFLLGSLSLDPVKFWHQDLAGEPWRRYRKNKNTLEDWDPRKACVVDRRIEIGKLQVSYNWWIMMGIIYCKLVWLALFLFTAGYASQVTSEIDIWLCTWEKYRLYSSLNDLVVLA